MHKSRHLAWAMPLAVVWVTTARAGEEGMAMRPRVLELDVHEVNGAVEVAVIGDTAKPIAVEYVLEVQGGSTTRHSGKTGLQPGIHRLSFVQLRDDRPWQVKLAVVQGDGQTYTLTRAGGGRE